MLWFKWSGPGFRYHIWAQQSRGSLLEDPGSEGWPVSFQRGAPGAARVLNGCEELATVLHHDIHQSRLGFLPISAARGDGAK